MQSWRSLLSIFTFFLAFATLSHAFPTPNNLAIQARAPIPEPNAVPVALERRCDDICQEAKHHNLHDVIVDVHVKIRAVVEIVKTYDICTPEKIQPHIDTIKGHIKHAHQTIKTYVEAEVDIDIILGGHSVEEIRASICAFLDIIVELVQFILQAGVDVTIKILIAILADLFESVCGLLHLFLTVVVGLQGSLSGNIEAFLAVAAQLGIAVQF
uniref:Uncharacterized protein n=1 Tax=Moniliophthora roreri TaxID=221103 RepID=A0A0W0FUT3_MONRR